MFGFQSPSPMGQQSMPAGMRPIARTVIDVSGTFTLKPLTRWFRVYCFGGGAGGSAAYDPYVPQWDGDGIGGEGGERDWDDFFASQVSGPVTVTIGAGGWAGSRSGDVGGYSLRYAPGAGGDTSFGTLLTARGGQIRGNSYDNFIYGLQYSTNRFDTSKNHRFGGGRRLLNSPIFRNNNSSNSTSLHFQVLEGEGPSMQNDTSGGGTLYFQANSWGGNRGGVGASVSSGGAYAVGAGYAFPHILSRTYLVMRGSSAPGNTANAAGADGIGNYPGGGGAGSGAVNGKGGHPSGGGAGGSDPGPGAGGRVIVEEWG